jgi:hypothetical protein
VPRARRSAPIVFSLAVLGVVGLTAILGVHGGVWLGALAFLAIIAGSLVLSAR